MSSTSFRFKQFTIHHDRTSMKVGTDGVLLGAWADIEHAKTILDIGTGTGIIAIMLAQRSRPDVMIEAVELDEH
jgi:tRNA1Val (adenine37-N6)-methyltransferase